MITPVSFPINLGAEEMRHGGNHGTSLRCGVRGGSICSLRRVGYRRSKASGLSWAGSCATMDMKGRMPRWEGADDAFGCS